MKILLLNASIKGTGTYRRCFYFGRELARAGHEVSLITVSRDSKSQPKVYYKKDWCQEAQQPQGEGPWIRIIEGPALGYRWLPGWGSGPLDIGFRIREIQTGGYDVVYGFEHHPNVAWPVYLTRGRNYTYLSDWCDWYAGSSNQFRGWKIAHKIDAFFEERIRFSAKRLSVTSRVLWDRAVSIGIRPERLAHIPEGAAVDYIRPFPKEQAREKFGLPAGIPVIVSVRNGNMHREVNTFHRVLQKIPDALYLMLGRPSASAISLAGSLGIAGRIHNAGWVSDSDYPLYLACADVCFCPLENTLNDRARWPAKILDFLAAGRATVTNGIGEVGPLFQGRSIGVLTGFEEQAYAEGIVSLLADEQLRCFSGINARRVMEEEWDYRLRGKLLERFIEG